MRIHLVYRFFSLVHLGLLRKLQQAERIVIRMDRKDAWVSTA